MSCIGIIIRLSVTLHFKGKISLFHGQGDFWHYLRLKMISIFGTINLLYLDQIPEEAKDAQILIHGHTISCFWNDDQRVLLNPGFCLLKS